jgi:UDP-N-acetylmuramoyl-L-alanyl-D-glutamate--2,6-diaminopimelate ligase
MRPPVPAGPYLVVGLGRAGRAAIEALTARCGAESIGAWDDSPSDAARSLRASLAARGVRFEAGIAASLRDVNAVVKSPGVYPSHPVLRAARERGVPVLDELELGWRLSSRPVVAVTGTNGKSTTARLVLSALEAAGQKPVLAGNTDSDRGCALSAVPADDDDEWVVAEVSSYQAEGCPEFLPSASVFTNLTRDHIHWHGSMSAYGAAKRRLFVRGDDAVSLAVLNVDDAFGRRLAQEVRDRGGRALTYGADRDAEYRILACASTLRDGRVTIDTPHGSVRTSTRLAGAHNAANVAAALAACDGLGLAREPTLEAIAGMPPLPGRFEPVDAGQPFDVVVDYAHTPDGVERVLGAAREIAQSRGARVIAVMGGIARGDRRTRELTGRAAREAADHVVLCPSSQNGEPPLVALSGLLAGARGAGGGTLDVVLDRRAAIARALAGARPGDVVAILGRGPLNRMAYGARARPTPFDDRQVARELLQEL